MRPRLVAELRRGTVTGFVATATMTATTSIERKLRSPTDHPVDYDASSHVVTAAATALRVRPRNPLQRNALFAAVHWGYGSAVAVGYQLARRRFSAPLATVLFYAACQSMAWTLFPLLGGTPPPWRWRKDILASSLAQHAIYALTVSAADAAYRRR